jgi:hypothetical protein
VTALDTIALALCLILSGCGAPAPGDGARAVHWALTEAGPLGTTLYDDHCAYLVWSAWMMGAQRDLDEFSAHDWLDIRTARETCEAYRVQGRLVTDCSTVPEGMPVFWAGPNASGLGHVALSLGYRAEDGSIAVFGTNSEPGLGVRSIAWWDARLGPASGWGREP